ncbi:MAG TPA: HDOD domain-containing protein [Bryobacteraceae bacterium]|nr:HDOD domain-containing protein [Bryobacteraceae bacterium]
MGVELKPTDKLAEFLEDIAGLAEFPALSRSIEQVLLKVDEEASLQHITNVILKDYSLTLRILRTANSALYNRSGGHIRSISHAVSLLGVESVREMATGVVLLEHFRKHSPGLKELILLSLLTANHAREVADRARYPKREEAYLCGMFRNLGEVLVACYHPRGYASVLLRVQDDRIPAAQACLEELGFDYDQAGRAVAMQWSIPESVRDCMNDRVLRLRRAPSTEAERLAAITHFAHKLTTAVYRREASGARASVNLLLHSLGPVLGLSHDDVKSIVESALEETKEVFQAMNVPMDHLRLKRQTEAALEQIDEEEPPMDAGGEPETETETFSTLLRDVTTQVDRGSADDLGAITMMVMEAIYRGGPFDHVLFALLDETGHRLVGITGFGESIDKLVKNFNFPVAGASGPVAVAVLKRTDVFVSGPRDRRFDGTRFSQVVGEPVFGLLPLVAGGAVAGCLYFDRHDPKSFDPAALASIGALRDQLCRALTRSRTRSALTTADPVR